MMKNCLIDHEDAAEVNSLISHVRSLSLSLSRNFPIIIVFFWKKLSPLSLNSQLDDDDERISKLREFSKHFPPCLKESSILVSNSAN